LFADVRDELPKRAGGADGLALGAPRRARTHRAGQRRAREPFVDRARPPQAQRLADWLALEHIDRILSSPQRRAIETAEPIADAHGLKIEVVEGLVEYDVQSDHYIPMEELRATNDPACET